MVKAYDVIDNFTYVSAGGIVFAGYIPKGISGSNGYCICIAVSRCRCGLYAAQYRSKNNAQRAEESKSSFINDFYVLF